MALQDFINFVILVSMKIKNKEIQVVKIPIQNFDLEGELAIPKAAKGLIIFAHGSGSGRHSPRNKFVANILQKAGIATLLVDLLTEAEDQDYQNRFDIALLTGRLRDVADWATNFPATKNLPIGYFGGSTGAAAAMFAAAQNQDKIKVLISRGGRVDLASEIADELKMPTLFIVGGADTGVLELNEKVFANLTCEKKLVIIPDATHLFEEKGALEQVANEAAAWCSKYFDLRRTL